MTPWLEQPAPNANFLIKYTKKGSDDVLQGARAI